ncbi:putative ribonuclease H-like domain-containing protein [Tanacetum coccineum]
MHGTKWVFRNKKDERGIVIKNIARLVAQGYTQEEWIDYDKVFAPVARIEAIRGSQCFHHQDLRSRLPNRVYKVEKALYGLHQAPRAWYETLLTYLLDNGFQRGKIDKTLFIKRNKGDILLVQVKKQKEKGILLFKDKYVTEILKKFGFTDVKTADDTYRNSKAFAQDEGWREVDGHLYRSMIGSLMYLTSSRLDIIYLKGQLKLGLWYPKDLPFDLVAYTDSDYARANLDMKSTTGEAEYVALLPRCSGQVKTVNGEVQLQALVDGKKIIVTKAFVRRNLQLNDEEGTDCLLNATNFKDFTEMG